MSTVSRYKLLPFFSHVQGEAHTHLIVIKGGKTYGGKGYGCWFLPVGTALSEVPLNDQSVSLALKGKTSDFQEVTVTAQAWYTVSDAEKVASRFDFSVSTTTGKYNADPLTVIEGALVSAAQEAVWNYISSMSLEDLLASGLDVMGSKAMKPLEELDFGVTVSRVAIMEVRPSEDIETALEAETLESLQMKADAAGFARRATATEQERAIEEAVLKNQLAIAQQRTGVIAQLDLNTRKEAEAAVASAKIRSEGELAVAARKAEDALKINQAAVEAALTNKIKEGAEVLRMEEAKAASTLKARIESDFQFVQNKESLLAVEYKAEERRVNMYAAETGQNAARAIAKIGLPAALSNLRVVGGDNFQVVLSELE